MTKVLCGECQRFIGYVPGPTFHTIEGLCATCDMKREEDRELIRKHTYKVCDMIEDLMMFDPIPRRRE
jgi:hypothetical protein